MTHPTDPAMTEPAPMTEILRDSRLDHFPSETKAIFDLVSSLYNRLDAKDREIADLKAIREQMFQDVVDRDESLERLKTELAGRDALLNHILIEVAALEDFDAESLRKEIVETISGTRIFNDTLAFEKEIDRLKAELSALRAPPAGDERGQGSKDYDLYLAIKAGIEEAMKHGFGNRGACGFIADQIYAAGFTRRAPIDREGLAEWLIWSNQHRAWWRPNSAGYTVHIEAAGRYTLKDCLARCGHRDAPNKAGQIPDEIPQPSPELIAFLSGAKEG